jgi:hypothetical protein
VTKATETSEETSARNCWRDSRPISFCFQEFTESSGIFWGRNWILWSRIVWNFIELSADKSPSYLTPWSSSLSSTWSNNSRHCWTFERTWSSLLSRTLSSLFRLPILSPNTKTVRQTLIVFYYGGLLAFLKESRNHLERSSIATNLPWIFSFLSLPCLSTAIFPLTTIF